MKFIFTLWFFIFADVAAYISVPSPERHEAGWWRLIPGGGYVLAIQHHANQNDKTTDKGALKP